MVTVTEVANRLKEGMVLLEEDLNFSGLYADRMDISDEGLTILYEDGSEFRITIEQIRGQ